MTSLPPGFEFLSDNGSVLDEADDVMELGPSREFPRWAVVILCVLATVGFFALASLKVHQPQRGSSAEQTDNTGPDAPADPLGDPVAINAASQSVDELVVGDRLYILRATDLTLLQLPSERALTSTSFATVDAVPDGAATRLLSDPSAGRVWLIVEGFRKVALTEFDAVTLRPLRHVSAPLSVFAAAASNGHLYLGTATGLTDLAPNSALTRIPHVPGPVNALAVDAARHRLLLITGSGPASISALSDGRITATWAFGDLAGSSITVVLNRIWIAGSGPNGGLVAQIEPVSLQPVQISPLAGTSSGTVVWPGRNTLWVTARGAFLSCVEPRNGAVLARWPAASTGVVVSHNGVAYLLADHKVRRLTLPQVCTG